VAEEPGVAAQGNLPLTDVCPTTLTSYLRQYRDGGIEALKTLSFRRPSSNLEPHGGTLEAYFREHPPASTKQAMAMIETLTGIKRSPERVRKFMKHMGMKCRKVGMIPSKADDEVQEKYKKEKLEPRLEEAKAGLRAVYFVDAAHFVLAPFLGMLWCFVRQFIRAPAGRQRFNVLGALNAITHELVLVTNESYINAISVCDLLCRIVAENIGISHSKIHRFWRCRVYLKYKLPRIKESHRHDHERYLGLKPFETIKAVPVPQIGISHLESVRNAILHRHA
jgi:transposase